jgi:hypothetical protein
MGSMSESVMTVVDKSTRQFGSMSVREFCEWASIGRTDRVCGDKGRAPLCEKVRVADPDRLGGRAAVAPPKTTPTQFPTHNFSSTDRDSAHP